MNVDLMLSSYYPAAVQATLWEVRRSTADLSNSYCGSDDWRLKIPAARARIVAKEMRQNGFVVLPKRWVVERTFAWLGRCRRLAKDWECRDHRALAFLKLASIRLMLRKLCNPLMFPDRL
jgi:transposase